MLYIYIYLVTFTINIPQMLAYIPAPWILWVINTYHIVMRIPIKSKEPLIHFHSLGFRLDVFCEL